MQDRRLINARRNTTTIRPISQISRCVPVSRIEITVDERNKSALFTRIIHSKHYPDDFDHLLITFLITNLQFCLFLLEVAPDVTQFNNTRRGADRVTRYVNVSGNEPGDTGTAGRWKVSAKIQQLLNTLKRPKRRPLPEFYEDNDIELEIAANPKDPNAPKPEGGVMTPVQGEQLVVMAGLSRTLESALQKFGTNSFKSPMATVMDPNMKMSTTLTYGKLLSRAMKIAYALSTKIFSKGAENVTLKAGDRVALVYPNSDPLK